MTLPLISSANILRVNGVQVAVNGQGQIKANESRPVWIVTLRPGTIAGDKIVVKAELANAGQYISGKSAQFGGKLMRQVNDDVKVAILNASELDALCSVRVLMNFTRGGGAAGYRLGVEYMNLLKSAGEMFTWIKMKYVDSIIGIDFKDKLDARNFLMDIRMTHEALSSLGEVVAVDIFSGNSDRFVHSGAKLGSIQNIGNVLFTKKDGVIQGLGLDWFEAQGESSNMYAPPAADWRGPMLNNPAELKNFSKRAVDALSDALTSQIDDEEFKLEMVHAEWFEEGLVSGRDKLRDYLQRRRGQGKVLPAGVIQRANIMGWRL